MVISAIVVSIMVISVSSMIADAGRMEIDNPESAYTVQEIREEAEKIDDMEDEKQRSNFVRLVESVEGFSTTTSYDQDQGCINVTMTSTSERHELHCLD